MPTAFEEKLLSLLAKIVSDLEQIKSDLRVLLAEQQQRPPPAASPDGDYASEPPEFGRSGSSEEVLRYLRETRGEDVLLPLN